MSDSLNQKKTSRRKFTMLVAVAASGILAGTLASCKKDEAKTETTGKAATEAAAKHACKGQNACKGQGGCGSSDNGCKGKNSCKGKGGCNSAH